MGAPEIAADVEVCIAGGGPAGATLAQRLAALGHRVLVLERAVSAAGRPGESLAPSIAPVLAAAGAEEAVAASALRTTGSFVRWADRVSAARDHGEAASYQIDRGRFDEILLAAARRAGALVWRPATAGRPAREPASSGGQDGPEGRWLVPVRLTGVPGRPLRAVRARLLADATGRGGWLSGTRRRDGAPLIALTAQLRLAEERSTELPAMLPAMPCVEAQEEGWLWGAPLPGGRFSAMAFSDPACLPPRARWEAHFFDRLARSELLRGGRAAGLLGPVVARDASALHRQELIGPDWLRVGDASFAVDPLSSQGVQAAMAQALHAAVVLHTLLVAPAHAAAARRFYRERQAEAIAQHRRWAAQLYAERHPSLAGAFWRRRAAAVAEGSSAPAREQQSRSAPGSSLGSSLGSALGSSLGSEPAAPLGSPLDSPPEPAAAPLRLALGARLHLAPGAAITTVPRIERDLVTLGAAVTHPRLARPIAYLGGVELAPLLASLRDGGDTVGNWLSHWSARLTPHKSRELLAWLLRARVVTSSAP